MLSSKEEIAVSLQFAELRRESTLAQLSKHFIPYYEELCFLLIGTFWAPYSGLRTLKAQEKLFNRGRTPESIAKGQKTVTRARAGYSPHNWGCATDWAEFRPDFRGQDIWNMANWKQFGDAVQKSGLIWGGNFKSIVDKPHCEVPISVKWKDIGEVYISMGSDKAIEMIDLKVIKYKKGVIL